jgi:hypothetical protein
MLPDQGEKLFTELGEPRRFVEIPGDHNDPHPGSERAYWEPIRAFVESCGAGQAVSPGAGRKPHPD